MRPFIRKVYTIRQGHTKKLKLCSLCDGTGVEIDETLEDYHNNIPKVAERICPKCLGTGRLVKHTYLEVKEVAYGIQVKITEGENIIPNEIGQCQDA